MARAKVTPKIVSEKNIELNLATPEHKDQITAIGKALSSPIRIDILNLLKINPMPLQEIARTLNLPLSSTAMHIKCLEAAHLIVTENQPGIHGSMRLSICGFLSFHLEAYDSDIDVKSSSLLLEMPVGNYSNFSVKPACGLAGMEGIIDSYDNPMSFYSVDRQNAQLLWFNQGYLEYHFPNKINPLLDLHELTFSLEICSEAPGYLENCPSDITFYINDCEIGTYTSPGDFGARRGNLTPDVWPSGRTQYGLLTIISLRPDGGYINGELCNPEVSLSSANFSEKPYISFKIEIKENAKHIGGINIFGKEYGDFPQGICMRIIY